jgi:LuxR family transcriptional regulator, maltose regulon positive regulatory protein
MPPHFLLREGLIEKIGNDAPRANFLIAPTGYGKTVLAAQWAAKITYPVAWYTVEKSDTPRDSLAHMICAYRRVLPNFTTAIDEDFFNNNSLEKIATLVTNELSQYETPIVQVVDNLELFSPAHLELNKLWASNLPKNLITLSIRQDLPKIKYSQAITLDAINIINAVDLKFQDSEIEYLAKNHNLEWKNLDIQNALKSAHGWPIAINSIIKSISKKPENTNVREIISANINIDNFFDQSIIDLPEDTINALVSLSLLEYFTSEEAEKLTKLTAINEILLSLSKDGILLIKISEQPNTFALNSIIRENFRNKSKYRAKIDLETATRAAAIKINQNDVLGALDILRNFGAREEFNRLIREKFTQIFFTTDAEVLAKLADTFADSHGFKNSASAILQGYKAFSLGNNEDLLFQLKELEVLSEGTLNPNLSKFHQNILRSYFAFLFGNFDKIFEIADQFPEYKDEVQDGANFNSLSYFRPALLSAFYLQDFEKFSHYFNQIKSGKENIVGTIYGAWNHSFNAMNNFLEGNYRLAFEFATASLSAAKELRISGAFIPFESAYILADTSLEFDELESSRKYSQEFLELATEYNQYPWIMAFWAKKAMFNFQSGKVEKAFAALKSGREVASNSRFNQLLFSLLDSHELVMRFASKDHSRIAELLHRLPETGRNRVYKLTLEKMNRPNAAKEMEAALPATTTLEKFYKAMLLALVPDVNRNDVKKHLRSALDLAAENGYFRAFLNTPLPVKEIILELLKENPTVYNESLSRTIHNQLSLETGARAVGQSNLTKRELEILRRLSTNLPINEISKSLHISLNTIKTHLKSIYRKLAVQTRYEAVARASELDLL